MSTAPEKYNSGESKAKKFWRYVLLLAILAAALVTLSLSVGSTDLGLKSIFTWLLHPESLPENQRYIIEALRIPRTFACLFVGASLALAGGVLQTLLSNPLADPYTLGLSGAASLGGSLAFILGLSPAWVMVPAGAFAFCWIVTILLLVLLRRESFLMRSRAFILVGVVISLFCGSMVNVTLALLEPSKLQSAFFWMVGQVGSVRDAWWPVLAGVFGLAFCYFFKNRDHLDRFLLGDEVAQSLGTDVQRYRRNFIIAVALLTSVAVAIAGVMGFVGLVSAHYAHRLIGSRRHGLLLPLCFLSGACMMMFADILGRYFGGVQEIPAGSITALIGTPLFLNQLLSKASDVSAGA